MHDLSPDEIQALADANYTSRGYETREDRLFALLVDVAWAFELLKRGRLPDPTEPLPQAPDGSVSLEHKLSQSMTPRDLMFMDLNDNLDVRDERG